MPVEKTGLKSGVREAAAARSSGLAAQSARIQKPRLVLVSTRAVEEFCTYYVGDVEQASRLLGGRREPVARFDFLTPHLDSCTIQGIERG